MDPMQNGGQGDTKSYGPLIGIIIIVVILILGAFYFLNTRVSPSGASTETSLAASTTPLSSSDEVSSIEADLKATNSSSDLSDLDAI